jgi:hypothetical protein
MPLSRPLLDRQVSLLAYLTSGDAIFGDCRAAAPTPAPEGIDRAALDLVARFSHNKRMEKIAATFPKTLALLAADKRAIISDFARACAPTGTGRVDNAREFYDFLSGGGRDRPLEPAYLLDVAACELACAMARAWRG